MVVDYILEINLAKRKKKKKKKKKKWLYSLLMVLSNQNY